MDIPSVRSRILVIDDDESYRILLRHYLEKSGYDVIDAADGANALRIVRVEQLQLLILDIVMPDMEGLETIQELRRQGNKTKILAVSGAGQAQGYLKMAKLFGADATADKCTPMPELLGTVATLIEQR